MKFNIDTKFNIGDAVYSAEPYEIYLANPMPYFVTDICIRATRTKDVVITYKLIQNKLTDVVAENFLFATYEECKRWCDERNKEEEI